MTKMNWERPRRDRQSQKKAPWAAQFRGTCATCNEHFFEFTLIQRNHFGQIVHYGGCPKKRGSRT